MKNSAMDTALGKLKMDYRNFGLMIGELEVAVESMEGTDLVNAIDQIATRYNFPVL